METKLSKLSPIEIASAFDQLSTERRYAIIPIGFPQAGKSFFLSSIMYYARGPEGVQVPFSTTIHSHFPYYSGFIAQERMVDSFREGRIYPTTDNETMDAIALDIVPNKAKSFWGKPKPSLNLMFLDLAGEDIRKVLPPTFPKGMGRFPNFINHAFEGLLYQGRPIFLLMTPFAPQTGLTHSDEDSLLMYFINHLETQWPRLFEKALFYIVISKWDLNSDPNLSEEEYIASRRPQTYNKIQKMVCQYGGYSVGNILTTKVYDDAGNIIDYDARVQHVDFDYPYRFWKNLYQTITGQSLE